MSHETDDAFWEAALKDFPKLPHLAQVKIIYNYRTHKTFNTSCWSRFNSILSNRAILPLLKGVDVCPTIRSQRTGSRNTHDIRKALSALVSSGLRLTLWGEPGADVFFFSIKVMGY